MTEAITEIQSSRLLKEFGAELAWKRKPTWPTEHAGLRLDYWRSHWRILHDAEDFRRRKHFFKVTADDRMVAAGKFDEWNTVPPWKSDLRRFAQAADTVTKGTFQMAVAMFSSFCQTERRVGLCPLDYGSIVLFDRLCIEASSAYESNVVWKLIQKIVRGFERGRRVAGIILKAYPLEYEGGVTDQNRPAFNHRQRAMLRHYTRHLGTVTLPGEPGQEGWQWLGMGCKIEPKASRRQLNIPG
jgi:hypothetical protein